MKLIIEKRNRYGYLVGEVPEKLDTVLYNKLSYIRKGTEFMANPLWGIVHFYSRKNKKFPYGLISKVKDIVSQYASYDKEFTFEIREKWNSLIFYDNIDILSYSLRDYQIEAIKTMQNNNQGIINIATAGGKTYTTICFLKTIKSNFTALIVVPTIDLKLQWQKEILANSVSLEKNMDVLTYQSLKFVNSAYDIVIFDECHHLPAKSLYNLAQSAGNCRMYGLTATAFRSDGEDDRMFASLGNIIHVSDSKALIELGYLTNFEVKLVKYRNSEKLERWDTYSDVYNKVVVDSVDRNSQIINCAISHVNNQSVLILVDKIEHGTQLVNLIKKLYQELSVVFVNGTIKKKEREEILNNCNKGVYQIIIASKIYTEGINVPRLGTLILASSGKSSVKIVQSIGRVLRLFEGKQSATIYDIIDDCKYLVKHSNERLKLYKDQQYKIQWLT